MSAERIPARGPTHRNPHPRTTAPTRRTVTEPGRHLRVVGRDEPRRRRVSPIVGVACTALLFVGLFALAGTHTLLVQGQIRLDALGDEVSAEQARYQELRLRVAELEAPSRVVAAAQERLGMVPPAQLVYLSPTEPVPAGPAVAAGPTGATPAEQAGDDAWTVIKPLLEVAAP
jgi:hypothetical protein